MQDYRLGLYEKAMPDTLSWAEKLYGAKQAGYDYLEMSVDEGSAKLSRLDMAAKDRLDLVKEMCRQGIRIESMCLSAHRRFPLGSMDAAVRERSIEILKKAVLLAGDLGIRIIQIAGYDEYYNPSSEETRAYFEESLRVCVEAAEQYGVLLGFETMETEFMNSVEKALRWVKKINSPYLQIYPDSGNITNAALIHGKDVLEDIRLGAGHIAAVHLKESLLGKYREIPYGLGHVDFQAIIRQAYALGVRRFTGEFWYAGDEDWLGYIRRNGAYLRMGNMRA